MTRRGDVYQARLDPAEGSEQRGDRPIVIVSRDAINQNSPVLIVVPLTDRANRKRIYPSQVILPQGEGGLTLESVALCEQVRALSKSRLLRQRGRLGEATMADIGAALKIALDLP